MTREEAIKYLKEMKNGCNDTFHKVRYVTKEETLDMAIKALEQEPFINKPCISSGVCEHDKNEVLDKIRAEIKGMTPTYHNPDWSITDLVPISEVLRLVDKYKAESEDKE